MQTTAELKLLTTITDTNQDPTFETVWGSIYNQNKTVIDKILVTPKIAFIALELEGDVYTKQPSYKMDAMAFIVPVTLAVVTIDGTEHRNTYGVQFEFDATKIDWFNFGGTLAQKQLHVPPMFYVNLDAHVSKDDMNVTLKPMYSLDTAYAKDYVQDTVFDGLFYTVTAAQPQAVHTTDLASVTRDELILISGYNCVETLKEELLQLRKQQLADTGALSTLKNYLTNKTQQEIERVTKINAKFNQPYLTGDKQATRFDVLFKQKGFRATTIQGIPQQLQLYVKETPNALFYVSPLVAFQLDKQNNYVFAYNLFEESILDAFTRLDNANQQLLASIVLATDLRTK